MSTESRTAHALMAAAIGAGVLGLTGCTRGSDTDATMSDGAPSGHGRNVVTVGFVGVGSEGSWRTANEASIQHSFTTQSGFSLEYAPSTNFDQASQIASFTSFVDEGVDVILLSATQSSGWEDTLGLAKAAKIPVILIDGKVDVDDPSLYVTRLAADNAAVAATVADWAVTAFPEGAKYFVLEGPSGTDTVTLREQGWDSVMAGHPEFEKIGAESADWSADKARSITASVLAANGNAVPLIVAQSDEMGLGAALAVEAAGLTPGVDVKIATIGGSKDALQALLGGRLAFVEEYNPLCGPTAVEVVNTVLAGGTLEPTVVVPSVPFASITREELDARQY